MTYPNDLKVLYSNMLFLRKQTYAWMAKNDYWKSVAILEKLF